MSRLLKLQDDGTYESEDGRFKAVRFMRSPKRGGGPEVQDGWTLLDTMTGARNGCHDLASANQVVQRRLDAIAEARATRDDYCGYVVGRGSNGIAEVRLVRKGAVANTVLLGIIGTRPDTPLSALGDLLKAATLSHLREVA